MCVKIIVSQRWDVFLRHSVRTHISMNQMTPDFCRHNTDAKELFIQLLLAPEDQMYTVT